MLIKYGIYQHIIFDLLAEAFLLISKTFGKNKWAGLFPAFCQNVER